MSMRPLMAVPPGDTAADSALAPPMAAPPGDGAADAPVPGPLMDRLGVGVATVDASGWAVQYENAQFRTWFPLRPDASTDTVTDRIAGFDAARARDRVDRDRPYRLEVEVRSGPRPSTLAVEVRRECVADEALVVVEVQNITKQKEIEHMLGSYSRLMERQARALEQEKNRAERLLLNIMPHSVAAELRDFGTTTPQSFASASVLMLDFVGFTEMAISRDPGALIGELNDVFTSFDRIMEHCGGERIKTIGDAYMAVAGLPEPDPDHEFHIARSALRMRRFLEGGYGSAVNRWQCRIGIGSGPLIGSIVGVQKYVYDIFGPAVNIASRLEHMAEPMQILVTAELEERLRNDFVLRRIGEFDIKGFGRQPVFALEDEARKVRK